MYVNIHLSKLANSFITFHVIFDRRHVNVIDPVGSVSLLLTGWS